MIYATRLQGKVTTDRRLIVQLPQDISAGEVEVIVLYSKTKTKTNPKRRRSGRAAHLAFGMWTDRKDIKDAAAYAIALRKRLEQRTDGKH